MGSGPGKLEADLSAEPESEGTAGAATASAQTPPAEASTLPSPVTTPSTGPSSSAGAGLGASAGDLKWGDRLVDSTMSIGIAILLLLSFEGLVKLNHFRRPEFRSYGLEWFDRIGIKEIGFFTAVCFLAAPAAILLARFGLIWGSRTLDRAVALVRRRPRLVLGLLIALALVGTVLVSWLALQHSALTDDENIQLFQGRLIMKGHLAIKEPPSQGPFEMPWLVTRDGFWTGIFPWGHAALLGVGEALGLAQAWPHLCAPLIVLMTYLLARELYPEDRMAALGGAALAATSPFLIFTCATLHNATTSALAIVLAAYALVRHVRRGGLAWALLAGLAIGLDLHARPFNAMLLGGFLWLSAGIALRVRQQSLVPLALGFGLGLSPFLGAQLFIDLQLTGQPLKPVLAYAHGVKRIFGFREMMAFGLRHRAIDALGVTATSMIRFVLWACGSGLAAVGVLLASVGVRRARRDWLLLGPAAVLFGGYFFFFRSPASETGPVYFLDALPFFAIFLARVLGAASDRLDRGDDRRGSRIVLAVALAMVGVAGGTFWPVQAKGAKMASNSILGPYQLVEDAGLHNALVWWNVPPGGKSDVTEPRPPAIDLSDDVLFARDTSGKGDLMRAQPGRKLFEIRYPGGRPTLLAWVPGPSEGASPYTWPVYPPPDTEYVRPAYDYEHDSANMDPLIPLKPDGVRPFR